MVETSAITWFDIDRELSVIQPETIKLDPHLLFAITNYRKEHHFYKVLEPLLYVGLPVIDET
jgi:hypothetical protein